MDLQIIVVRIGCWCESDNPELPLLPMEGNRERTEHIYRDATYLGCHALVILSSKEHFCLFW